MSPWLLTYLIGVPITAAVLMAAGDWLRRPGIPAPQRPALTALAGGLLWPVVAVGAAQMGVWVLLKRRCPESSRDRIDAAEARDRVA